MAAVNTSIDMKALTKYLKVSSGNLRAGDKDTMYDLLGVKGGSVTLFGLINDLEEKVRVLLDSRLASGEVEYVGFHPMVNTATTSIHYKDIQKFCDLSKHSVDVVDLVNMKVEEPAAGGGGGGKQKP